MNATLKIDFGCVCFALGILIGALGFRIYMSNGPVEIVDRRKRLVLKHLKVSLFLLAIKKVVELLSSGKLSPNIWSLDKRD